MQKKTVKELAKIELEKNNCFDMNRNILAMDFVKVLDKEVPFDMAFTIANFTMASFVGHFHFKIEISEENRVPMNLIAFILAKSGAKKTSSVQKMEKMIQIGLDIINKKREQKERQLAMELDAAPRTLMPLSNALSTAPGLLQNLNDFKEEGIGLPNMVVDEVSTAIATNIDFVPNVEIVAQLFDDGDCKVKVLKDKEQQSQEVKGMGMTALFVGSEKGILDDPSVLRKFLLEFISKLGRRAMFVYPSFEIAEEQEFDSIDDFLTLIDSEENDMRDYGKEIQRHVAKISANYIDKDVNKVGLDGDASRLWKIYQAYCKALADEIDEDEEVRKLEQEHRPWKMLKLAGVYTAWAEKDDISVQEIKEAIYAVENTGSHLNKFIIKARREPYELVIDWLQSHDEPLTTHQVIKLGWIKKKAQLTDIITNANSKLKGEGTIELVRDELHFRKFEFLSKDDKHWSSFKKLPKMEIEQTMEERNVSYQEAKQIEKTKRNYLINDEYVWKERDWNGLKALLCNDCAYTSFKFIGGRRGKDNIDSGSTFAILDIDDSDETINEVADRLQDFRYHMALTSDATNPYKFRVLLQFDIEVKIPRSQWTSFIEIVSMYLGLPMPIDKLPQSQIFYGFSDREVISNDGDMVEASKLIPEIPTDIPVAIKVSREARNAIWEDRKGEFKYAYEAESGKGYHLGLFRAMRHAADLGFSYDEVMELIDDIVDTNGTTPRNGFMNSLISQTQEVYGMDEKY